MSTLASKEGTIRYTQRFAGRAAEGHFREAQRLMLSSLGLGTYLGQPDEKTDEGYTAAVVTAVESGMNVLDTAINYRFQRSERSIGTAIQQLAGKGVARDELVGMQLRSVADRLCEGSLSPLLMNLVKASPLSDAELDELRRFVREQSRKRGGKP